MAGVWNSRKTCTALISGIFNVVKITTYTVVKRYRRKNKSEK